MKKLLLFAGFILLILMVYNGIKDRGGFNSGNSEESNSFSEYNLQPADDASEATLKNRQQVAISNLESICNYQDKYFQKNNTYASCLDDLPSFNSFGMKKNKYYTFRIESSSQYHYVARAEGNIDSDNYPDIIEIDEDRDLEHIYNDVEDN